MGQVIHQLPTGEILFFDGKKLTNIGKSVKLKVLLDQIEGSSATKAQKTRMKKEIEEISKSNQTESETKSPESDVLPPGKISGWGVLNLGETRSAGKNLYRKVADGWYKIPVR